MHLSIIIPAYNEESRIGDSLLKLHSFLLTKNYDYEIILVDDGSNDNTIAEAGKSALAKEGRLKIIRNGRNKGKGFSVRNGIMNSRGRYILFSDADLSTPIEEADNLFYYIKQGYDIVIGSRAVKGSNVKIHQVWYREIMGKTFNLFVKSSLIKEFNDTQCGFKLFKGDIARGIAVLMKIDGFCFDVEMLYLANLKGYRIKEAPVTWYNSPKSKVRPFIDSFKMLTELIFIKNIHKSRKTAYER